MKTHNPERTIQTKIRTSGFQCPFHSYQIVSYLVFLSTLLIFLVQIQGKSGISQVIVLPIFSFLSGLVVYYDFRLTISNPTDSRVLSYKKSSQGK